MHKTIYMLKETYYLIRRHKLIFLAPLLIILVLLGFLAYSLGPVMITSFIYAGF